jgi:transcription antitermination factor NusG
MPFWSAVRSQSQRERFASEQLGLRGYETFLPMVQTKRASAPLFNGYFFVRIVEQWRPINYTFGVLCLVRVGDCPARCPDHEVEALQALVVGGFVRLPEAPAKRGRHVFKRNERVRIIGGPFEGVRAIHSGMRAGDRERILLSLLGSSARPVMIPSHQIVAQ